MARNWLQKIAALEFEARGPRKNGGLLSGWARQLFRGKSLQEIAFEIWMLGQHGARLSTTPKRHVLRALPRSVFSALDIEVDLGEGWGMAERLVRD